MDEPGYRARRRAEKADKAAFQAGKHGLHAGIDTTVPLPEETNTSDSTDLNKIQVPGPLMSGFEEPGYRPPPNLPSDEIPGATSTGPGLQGAEESAPGVAKTALPVEAKKGQKGMNPHLQVMLGPYLRYDTVTSDGIYHAFAMIVTADTGSDYSTPPTLSYEWDPFAHHLSTQLDNTHISNDHQNNHGQDGELTDEGVEKKKFTGERIYQYFSLAGGMSFWRFKIEVQLGEVGTQVHYRVNNGGELAFWVPARDENFRWVGHSCNGFSSGVDTDSFNGPSPLWSDVLRSHAEKPIHVLIGGGDQIYCDPLTREPEISPWIEEPDEKKKIKEELTDGMKLALDRFMFNHYTLWFRSGSFGKAIQQIPMLNICDDHDIIDGFGSYPDDLQSSPVFSAIGARGYFWYLLFQMFVVDDVDGTISSPTGQHPSKSLVWGGEGAWIPFPNRSWLSYLGPKVYILLLDCRAERKKDQICSQLTYDNCFKAIKQLPGEVEHLVLLLGVPIVYPRMVGLEKVLGSKFNPITMIAKTGSLGLGGFVNKFNKEAELLDDLNDHWCAETHKAERNELIKNLQKLSLETKLRVTFLSGDVHAAAVGKLFTHKKEIEPALDQKFMLQIISSAIVNTPPPPAVIKMISTLGKKTHKTLHHAETDEVLVPIFDEDTDGGKHNGTVMGRRNYCLVDYLAPSGDLKFDIRVEKTQGSGTTKGYAISAPKPGW